MLKRLAPLLSIVLIVGGSLLMAPPASARDVDCGNFSSQKAAQIFFLKAGGPSYDPNYLDSDNDGIACESNPAPYYYGKTLPGGGGGNPDPEPQPSVIKSSVTFTLSPDKRIFGESVKLIANVHPAISRKVNFQQKVGDKWKAFAAGTTGSTGKLTTVVAAPRKTVSLRAVVAPVTKGNNKYTSAASDTRSLKIQEQRVDLRFVDSVVAQGDEARALIHATPIREGRAVSLEVRRNGRWQVVDRSKVDRKGRAEITLMPDLGELSYRAVVLERRGASEAHSQARTLKAVDMTAPNAPTDLVATAGDTIVDLNWAQAATSDLAGFEVWVRSENTPPTMVATTTSPAFQATGLQNGITYYFTVRSIDVNGNMSAFAAEIAATPAPAATSGRAVAPA